MVLLGAEATTYGLKYLADRPRLPTLAIGASRLVLGLHYLSDVLAGYAIGGAWLLAGSRWAMPQGAQYPEQVDRN